ncbi:hypothetical protein [Ferrimonas balearica]|uniref:hypothetical protein n=1 Tax=Ferrimonas balearica TaxID=44012 RepID=UPI001F3DA7E9|nr:hypothetical protein [Ferrimonas balearica]MBY6096077.1 hypothetical protein [Ferrimonas balearica]
MGLTLDTFSPRTTARTPILLRCGRGPYAAFSTIPLNIFGVASHSSPLLSPSFHRAFRLNASASQQRFTIFPVDLHVPKPVKCYRIGLQGVAHKAFFGIFLGVAYCRTM